MAVRSRITKDEWDLLFAARNEGVFTDQLRGRSVSVTGKTSMVRDDIVKLLALLGATFTERPVRGTTYLLVGDTGGHGMTDKINKANALGVNILEEHEFAAMLLVQL